MVINSMLGIGIDVVNISRIKGILEQYGTRFTNRLLSESELNDYSKLKGNGVALFCAKRFAAKEAFAKAIGTGINNGIYLKSMWIKHNNSGAPLLEVSHACADIMTDKLSIPFKNIAIHVSLSDDPPVAMAVVSVSIKYTIDI